MRTRCGETVMPRIVSLLVYYPKATEAPVTCFTCIAGGVKAEKKAKPRTRRP